MSIKCGDVEFEGPYKITDWDPPFRAGIYSIMYKKNPKTKPNTYSILYFGESGNLDDRGFFQSHHKYNCWIEYAGTEENLFIGIHLMPNSTEEKRRRIESDLINEYRPACN